MKPTLISQFENLAALTNTAAQTKWARHGEWWYYSDSATGLLMRVPISDPDDWDLDEHNMQRLRPSTHPVFHHNQTEYSEVISQDISRDGNYTCSATRSPSDDIIRLDVREAKSQRIVFSKSLRGWMLDRIYLSKNGEGIYFTCPSSSHHSKSLWAIIADSRKAQHPICLFAGHSGDNLSVSRTTSQRFLKVIHTSSSRRVFTLIDLDTTQIHSGIEVATGLASKHYTFEHLECEGIDFAFLIDYISEGQVDIRRAATTSLIGTAIDNTGQYFARNAGLANKIELRGLNSMSQYGIAHPRTLKGITNFSAPNTQRLWYGTAYDSLIGFSADIDTGVIDNVLSK
ncbi:hypothetical protein [Actinotignum urinale]|uniref:Ig-like domain-containing protein n=1 Tax=Actinotignum urinale TaxID=190146 RepID=A0ABU5G9G7_9ACTO|nr:hypothetical protein [Actinotignum urinale]MDY5133574.1 hypothetical protein [Actinotignum urinale]